MIWFKATTCYLLNICPIFSLSLFFSFLICFGLSSYHDFIFFFHDFILSLVSPLGKVLCCDILMVALEFIL